MADWSSLPADLINRIADLFLAADDLDYYTNYRAVCHSWRSATADPSSSPADPRFRLRHWAMLDEPFQTDARLFVNSTTGRFVRKHLPFYRATGIRRFARKDLPLLRGYHHVATAPGGRLVLAEKKPPHAARVLNPFTGAMVRFAAPVPLEDGLDAHLLDPSPTVVLLCHSSCKAYWADPDSERFAVHDEMNACDIIRVAAVCGLYDDAIAAGEKGSMASLLLPVAEAFRRIGISFSASRFFPVESAGELLIVWKIGRQMGAFKVDKGTGYVEPVKSLGDGRALFFGKTRCLSVNAAQFGSIDANCIYYQECDAASGDIYMYDMIDIEDEEPMKISGAIKISGDIDRNRVFLSSASPPFTVIQLLAAYAYEARVSGLSWLKKLGSLPNRSPWDILYVSLEGLLDEFDD